MNKTVRYILYILVLIICIVAIFIGVYNMELAVAKQRTNEINDEAEKNISYDTETTADRFKKLFTNDFFASNYDDSKIAKLDSAKPLVYGESQIASKDGQYKIDAYLPVININSEVAKKFNNDTIANFANRATILINSASSSVNTIYDTSYTSYINNNVLSVAIMGSLKEGNSAQRVLLKTYNYNLDTGKEVKLSEVLTQRGIEPDIVNKKINTEIKEASDRAETVAQIGHEIYKRNTEDSMYNVNNVTNYIIGPNGVIYIVYAYGNLNNTSELDVIEIGYE